VEKFFANLKASSKMRVLEDLGSYPLLEANNADLLDGELIKEDFKRFYTITSRERSEAAIILVAQRREDPSQRVALKLLRPYKDTRFSLLMRSERQQCQLKALQKNPYFSPDVYYGLAPVLEFVEERDSICLGSIGNSVEEMRMHLSETPPYEYALVMAVLPKERRLDHLLGRESAKKQKALIENLIERIVGIHESIEVVHGYNEQGMKWGSFEQLELKMYHNLELFSLLEQVAGGRLYYRYEWLKEVLLRVVRQPLLQASFDRRVCSQCIKNCHGDLKASNIWIVDVHKDCDDPLKGVRILDAIDFNPTYHNIDVLSDIAMLAVDVEVNSLISIPSDFVIQRYLEHMRMDYQEIKYLLAYYLAEKAIVRAIVSLVYDHEPFFVGKKFLNIAARHADALKKLL
jgi:aminoglycoside phosphotransferase family enzyme